MASNRFFVLLFSVVYFMCLAAMIPASMLGSVIDKYSHGSVVLANCRGTIWSGSATAAFRQNPASPTPLALGELQWHVPALSILTLRPAIHVSWPHRPQKAPTIVRASIRQIDVSNLFLPLPAPILAEVSPYLRPLELDGQIVMQSESLSLTPDGLHGTLSAQLADLRSGLSSVSPLGNYQLTAQCAGTNCALSLSTISGKLLLQGQGKFDLNGSVAFNGQAQAADGQREALGEILQNIGPEIGAGLHAFSIAGGK